MLIFEPYFVVTWYNLTKLRSSSPQCHSWIFIGRLSVYKHLKMRMNTHCDTRWSCTHAFTLHHQDDKLCQIPNSYTLFLPYFRYLTLAVLSFSKNTYILANTSSHFSSVNGYASGEYLDHNSLLFSVSRTITCGLFGSL